MYKFGGFAIREGLLSITQLKYILIFQISMLKEKGYTNPVGEIAIHLGYMDRDGVDYIISLLSEQESNRSFG